jgi:hypothetical protein
MKTKFQIAIMSLIVLFSFLTACQPGQLFAPTPTPTATNTQTSTPTPTSTSTLTLTPTLTSTPITMENATIAPTPACIMKSGEWNSNETSGAFGLPIPIFTFTVHNCRITSWEIWAYPLPGELLWWEGASPILITDDSFSVDVDTGMGIFTLQGNFDAEGSSSGVLKFPKDFSVFGAVLNQDVDIPWTASP